MIFFPFPLHGFILYLCILRLQYEQGNYAINGGTPIMKLPGTSYYYGLWFMFIVHTFFPHFLDLLGLLFYLFLSIL
jgi:hypothetical protein